ARATALARRSITNRSRIIAPIAHSSTARNGNVSGLSVRCARGEALMPPLPDVGRAERSHCHLSVPLAGGSPPSGSGPLLRTCPRRPALPGCGSAPPGDAATAVLHPSADPALAPGLLLARRAE